MKRSCTNHLLIHFSDQKTESGREGTDGQIGYGPPAQEEHGKRKTDMLRTQIENSKPSRAAVSLRREVTKSSRRLLEPRHARCCKEFRKENENEFRQVKAQVSLSCYHSRAPAPAPSNPRPRSISTCRSRGSAGDSERTPPCQQRPPRLLTRSPNFRV